jgi:hypothetical protein
MSARRAFVLGAIVGAGVLAAVGAVSAASVDSIRPASRTDGSPKTALEDLAHIDSQLTKAINDAKEGKDVESRIGTIAKAKLELVDSQLGAAVDGVKGGTWFRALECVDFRLSLAKLAEQGHLPKHGATGPFGVVTELEYAKACKQSLEAAIQKANPPSTGKVSITESDTWAHNQAIGKSNVCINVKTTPPQSFVSGTLTGPGGFTASTNGNKPLHADGTAQIRTPITQAGSYTDNLTVYDKNGTQTATSSNTFTVDPPPQDGPTPAFGPSCPAPTQ